MLRLFVRWSWRAFKVVLLLVIVLAIAIAGFLWLAPSFGGSASGEDLARVKASPNFRYERFVNLTDTTLDTKAPDKSMNLSTYFFPAPGKNPSAPLPSRA